MVNAIFTEWPQLRSVGRKPPKAHQIEKSAYRPQVAAGDRVFCWTVPQIIAKRRLILQDSWQVSLALDRERAYEATWELSTRTGHGAGLLRYAEYCASQGVPENKRFPVTAEIVAAFLGWAGGQLGSSGVRTWLGGLQAWHTIHGFEFPPTDSGPIKAALRAVEKLAPAKSKKPARPPVSLEHLEVLYKELDFTNSFDIAVWAIACIAFWGLARLGELTVTALPFDGTRHVSFSAAIEWKTQEGVHSASLPIPWTKTTQTQGATILLTRERMEKSCPVQALWMQIRANSALPPEAHLFGYTTLEGKWKPMLKHLMMERCQAIWQEAGIQGPSGHSFRIGGTLHLLSRGTDVQIVQRLGRWSSDAFFLYWRNAQAIIPLHVASAAEGERIRKAVEEHLEGSDGELLQAWKRIESQRQNIKSKQTARPKKK